MKAGADPDKLVLGIPTYGRSYTLINPDATDIGSPAEGPGEKGEFTKEQGYLAYYEVSFFFIHNHAQLFTYNFLFSKRFVKESNQKIGR